MNSDSKYKELFHSSPCGYMILSKKNQILEVNDTLVHRLGYSESAEIAGKHLQDLLSIADKIYYETHFYPLILIQKHIKEVNFQLLRKDRSAIPVLVDGKLVNDPSSLQEIFLLSILDITHRKSYENELKKSKEDHEALAADLNKTLNIIDKEISKAEYVQKSLLPPSSFLSKEKSFSIESFFRPLDRVSGDIYDYFLLDENTYRFFIADATGHGLSAGFQTMSIHTEYQRIKKFLSPNKIIETLNDSTFRIFQGRIMIYTCFVMDINLKTNTIEYSSAGHPAQLVYSGGCFQELEVTTPIIGFQKNLNARSRTIQIDRVFSILLYTDGIEEQLNQDLEIFGLERLKKSMLSNMNDPDTSLFGKLMEDIDAFRGEVEIRDDITVIKIVRFGL